MEDVLTVYKRPYSPDAPVVCMDETGKQLIRETRLQMQAKPGKPARYDYEYDRNGVCSLFMFYEPFGGKRFLSVTDRRTKVDWAIQIKKLLDICYPDVQKIILVMDNLNTHTGASLYKAFEPQEARRLLNRLEIHYTPKHGSWLNIAEIELWILNGQGLKRRFPDKKILSSEVMTWQEKRNFNQAKLD
jgi:hypothetical protein